MTNSSKKTAKKHSSFAIFLTGFLTILLLIGLIAGGIMLAMRKTTPPDMILPDGVEGEGGEAPSLVPQLSGLKTGDYIYDGLLSIIAKQDMPAFTSADELPDEQLISFGIWAMLIDNAYSRYPLEEDGTMHIPAADVAKSIVSHFNLTRPIPNRTTEVYSEFVYFAENDSYIVPVYGSDAAYLPRVRSIVFEADVCTIELDYLRFSQLGEDATVPSDIAPEKSMRIRVTGGETDYKILSIEAI